MISHCIMVGRFLQAVIDFEVSNGLRNGPLQLVKSVWVNVMRNKPTLCTSQKWFPVNTSNPKQQATVSLNFELVFRA